MDGNFKMRIGGTPKGPNSNDTNGGLNGTPLLYQATDMVSRSRRPTGCIFPTATGIVTC